MHSDILLQFIFWRLAHTVVTCTGYIWIITNWSLIQFIVITISLIRVTITYGMFRCIRKYFQFNLSFCHSCMPATQLYATVIYMNAILIHRLSLKHYLLLAILDVEYLLPVSHSPSLQWLFYGTLVYGIHAHVNLIHMHYDISVENKFLTKYQISFILICPLHYWLDS